jgi:hypothetical protein
MRKIRKQGKRSKPKQSRMLSSVVARHLDEGQVGDVLADVLGLALALGRVDVDVGGGDVLAGGRALEVEDGGVAVARRGAVEVVVVDVRDEEGRRVLGAGLGVGADIYETTEERRERESGAVRDGPCKGHSTKSRSQVAGGDDDGVVDVLDLVVGEADVPYVTRTSSARRRDGRASKISKRLVEGRSKRKQETRKRQRQRTNVTDLGSGEPPQTLIRAPFWALSMAGSRTARKARTSGLESSVSG